MVLALTINGPTGMIAVLVVLAGLCCVFGESDKPDLEKNLG